MPIIEYTDFDYIKNTIKYYCKIYYIENIIYKFVYTSLYTLYTLIPGYHITPFPSLITPTTKC